MNLATFSACLAGYQDRLEDMQILAVISGFWSGYYTNSKRPKPLKSIINKIAGSRKHKKAAHVDTVDVEEFKRKEAEFKRRLEQGDGA